MYISKAREQITSPLNQQKCKLKDTSIIYLLAKAKNKFSLKKIIGKRKWRSKSKKIRHSKSKLKEAFSLFDRYGNGMVDPSDLGFMIRTLGGNPTEAQLDDIKTKEKLNGPIDHEKFVGLMRKYMWARPKQQELQKVFKVIDNNDDGYVAVSKIRHILTTMGESLDHEEFDEWMQSLGVNDDEIVSYDEIIAPIFATIP